MILMSCGGYHWRPEDIIREQPGEVNQVFSQLTGGRNIQQLAILRYRPTGQFQAVCPQLIDDLVVT